MPSSSTPLREIPPSPAADHEGRWPVERLREEIARGAASADREDIFTEEEVFAELDADQRAQCGKGLDEYGVDE